MHNFSNKHCDYHAHHEHNHCSVCSCEHNRSDAESKIILARLIIGTVLLACGIFSRILILFLVSYLILGYDILTGSVKDLVKKHIFSENFLMSIASLGAIVLGQYAEGCAVMLFYQLGELFCETASKKSEKSVKELISIKPEYANLIEGNTVKKIVPELLKKGDIVAVSSGEKIPADGEIIDGKTQLDTSSMTGEAEYRYVKQGEHVISGCISCGSLIKIRVTADYEKSSVSKVLKLYDEIEQNKSESEKFITAFAKYYTPAVVIIALLVFLLPTIIFNQSFAVWGYRALMLLVVSCPCALIISVPLAFFLTNGCASKHGILIKGSAVLEKLAKVKIIAFDKTGTLTKGSFKLLSLHAKGIKAEVLEYLAYAEYYSSHPLAEAVIMEYKKIFDTEINADEINNYTEIPGKGISVAVKGKKVLAGNENLMISNNIKYDTAKSKNTVVYIALENTFIGFAEFTDGIKPEAFQAVKQLKSNGIKSVILSGDKKEAAKAVSAALDIDDVYYELLPQDKVEIMKKFKTEHITAFAGDGINDAPVISLADVGISMGLDGSDAAIEASDIVLLSDDISKIPLAVKLSKKSMNIVRQNIIVSIAAKLAIMLLSCFGISNLWLAVFGDVGISLLALLNSSRAFKFNEE